MKQLTFSNFELGPTKDKLRGILAALEGEERLALLSDLILDQVHILINKFPVKYQKEMVALLAVRFMEKWEAKAEG